MGAYGIAYGSCRVQRWRRSSRPHCRHIGTYVFGINRARRSYFTNRESFGHHISSRSLISNHGVGRWQHHGG